MAWASDITTLVTPGGTITFNAASGNTYMVDPDKCSGFGMAAVRAPIDDKGQASGYILHPFYESGTHLVVGGIIIADTTTNRDSLEGSLKTALRSILAADGTINWGAGASLTVRCDVGCDFPRVSAILHGFIFGLVSAAAL